MTIMQFVKSLIPGIERNELKEDIRITRKELSEKAIPLFNDANNYFIGAGFKSKEAIAINADFMNAFGKNLKYKNMIDVIARSMPTIETNLGFLEGMSDSLFSEKIMTSTITYKKTVLIRASDYIGFASIYSLNLLTLIYFYENKNYDKDGYQSAEMPKVRIEKIRNNVTNFARILATYSIKPSEFEKDYKEIPDVKIDDDFINTLESMKEKQFDKFDVPLTSQFEGNPIYHYRLMFAEWQANRYKTNKEKKKYLELRLMQLKMKANGETDPGLEKEIDYLESRISKLDYWLHKQEDSVK